MQLAMKQLLIIIGLVFGVWIYIFHVNSDAMARSLNDAEKCKLYGNVTDEYELGVLYYKDSKFIDAFNCYLVGANKGDYESISQVAGMYSLGIGVPKDIGKAVNWYKKLALYGDITALNDIGKLLLRNQPSGNAEVFAYFYTVALLNSNIADEYLKTLKQELSKVEQKKGILQSIDMLIKISDNGNPDAQYRLAKYYHEGVYITKDSIEALKWLMISEEIIVKGGMKMSTDVNDIVNMIGMIAREMTSAEIKQANERATKWLAR